MAAESENPDTLLYKLTFYVPQSHTQTCLDALWSTGAGRWPNGPRASACEPPKYTDVAFISPGMGQFKVSAHATPHIGTPGNGEAEHVSEDRVEMVIVGTATAKSAVAKLREVHPYEVVALFVVQCEDF
ncbi:hypothetical protein PV08_11082 [Exophiala spinifera]|uniref:ATP phosphoribosyltransferase n=1 Tax=Exophiala spinifera TaxID=91928 RepID=A0A0D1ZAT0_9EURO|nr:uncharacterized protein PV08_11082 [Exophiala spinifera]KIW10122.1 hypothetical protein PV08_11082 [Exophiala spinifera]